MDLAASEALALKPLSLLTAKPVLYIANVNEAGFSQNPRVGLLQQLAQAEGAQVVALSATLEAELVDMGADEKRLFLADLGLKEPGLDRVVRAGYQLLGLCTFFSTQSKEVRAWTVPCGATAVEAAAAIHSDFARGFIRAEVISYEDYVRFGGEHDAREAGRLRLEGRDYVVTDGDVMHFRFNV
jgi:ribosome-binding ATPase YchF (GTP1/OBG family)